MRVAAVVVSAALLGACASHAATPATTALTITVYPNGLNSAPVDRYSVHCGPPAGTVPDPATACRVLARLAHPFAPTPPGTFCTDIAIGPDEAVIRGRLRGTVVHAHLKVQGGCEINRWRRVAAVVPGFPGRP